MSEGAGLAAGLWFVGVVTALAVLFAAGLRVPTRAAGWPRRARQTALALAVGATVLLANMALYRHDLHLDLTRERAFTPSPEAQAVVQGLREPVEVVYFYQKQHPGGRAAKTMVETMGRLNPRLVVRTVDPDQQPALANRYGVRIYNTAVLLSGGRRVEVITTDERDIALGILRVTRAAPRVICFAAGHGQYDIDNFEFHTHFEGTNAHSHDLQGMAVVQTEQHGAGRLRRALEKLGLTSRKVTLATAGRIPDDCAALVDANPRTPVSPPEVALLRAFLERGGSWILLVEPDFPVEPRLAELLEVAGIRLGAGVIVDPTEHYFTDEQMVAVTRYGTHAVTRGLALTFFPGARPLELVPAPGVVTTALATSSADSHVVEGSLARPGARTGAGRARVLAATAEGRLPEGAGAQAFRLAAVGDADFASNSFFPYMSNADLALGLIAWALHEERAPTLKPPVEVLPTVTLTSQQVRGIFLGTAVVLPGAVALAGGVVWWRRRR